jgi:hypothetical protein
LTSFTGKKLVKYFSHDKDRRYSDLKYKLSFNVAFIADHRCLPLATIMVFWRFPVEVHVCDISDAKEFTDQSTHELKGPSFEIINL